MGESMPSEGEMIERQAPAKLNLALAVDAVNEDGMHPLCSWMAAVSMHDDVRMERLESGPSAYDISWLGDSPCLRTVDWSVDDDLGVRAHRLLESHFDRELPVRLSIGKRIPHGAGLGGGSSDAANVLLGLRDLFALSISAAELVALSKQIGSDVAFFISDDRAPAPAIVSGVGERIERCPALDGAAIIVIPEFGCSTPEVYRRFDAIETVRFRSGEVEEMARRGEVFGAALFNDLSDAAIEVEGRIGRILETTSSILDTPAHVTGSGSAVFTIVPARHAHMRAEELAYELSARRLGCSAVAAHFRF